MSYIYYYPSILSDEERKEMKLVIFMETYHPPSLDVEEEDSPPSRLICGRQSIRGVFSIDPVTDKYELVKKIKHELRQNACKHVQLSGEPPKDPYQVNYIIIECTLKIAQQVQMIKCCHKKWLYVHEQAYYRINAPKVIQVLPKLHPLALPPSKPDTLNKRIIRWHHEMRKSLGYIEPSPSEVTFTETDTGLPALTEQNIEHVKTDPISRRVASWREKIVSNRAPGPLERYASSRNVFFPRTIEPMTSKPLRAQSAHCLGRALISAPHF